MRDYNQKAEIGTTLAIRRQLTDFMINMEQVLVENDYKGGWDYCNIEYLRARLVEEVGEYFHLIANKEENTSKLRKELLDISNFCMMLWDRMSKEV